jgi:long-chain acyl-CoA synthetase
LNIATLLQRAGRIGGTRTALFEGARRVASHAELAERTARLAGFLSQRLSLRPGARVALVMKNCPAYVECLFACWHAGLACVPMNAKLHAREIAFILDNSSAELVIVTPDLGPTLNEALDAMEGAHPHVLEIGSPEQARALSHESAALHICAPDDLAWLFYTSGTTGRPKGAMLTHRNLTAAALAYLADVDPVALSDCILHPAPMSHGSGLYILPHVLAMAAQVVPESGRFEPDEIAALLRAHRGASFFAAPTMVGRLVNAGAIGEAELAGLKTIVYGGGPMYLEDCKRAIAVFGERLVQIYGQGESPMTITVLPKRFHRLGGDAADDARLASVGFAQSVVEVRVVGAGGEVLAAGETGEILVRGDTVMAGYFGNAAATAETLRGGFLHTGDLGAFDADGFLTLKDRSKDVVISGGSNIYPREVEEALLRHAAVAEAAVIGRPHPDWGEEVVAVVVPAAGTAPTPAELDAVCADSIARFKRPKAYLFVETLPKNNYGKVLKTELRRLAGQGG